MNATEPNTIEQELREEKLFEGISLTPSLALIKKTLIFDLLTIRRIILDVFLMVLVPIIALGFMAEYLSGEEHLLEYLGFATWYYNFAIMFPIIIIGATGPLIAEELRTGTLLFLVSKPINRTRIVLSKFIALYIFGVVISLLSLSIVSLFAIIIHPQFVDIGEYIGLFFLYSLIINLFFGGITMGFSSIFRKPRNVTFLPLALVIFSFLVIMMFKPFIIFAPENWYEKYLLYNLDIGYHFANVFMWIGEPIVPEIEDYFIAFVMFGMFEIDFDEGVGELTNYYHPVGSFIYLIVIAIIFVVIGIMYLKKRDIS
jgi:ABC-type transport system involved in multi-copper enzyme maturation permease subunit